MKQKETIKLLADKELLDKLYGFSYKRCSTSHEAEDLCSEIVLAILSSLHKDRSIDNFYAFAWTIAHRVYADFCKTRKKHRHMKSSAEADTVNIQTNPIDDYIRSQEDAEELNKILTEISFLSKIYREVMVMYYLDELPISQIAQRLSISETAVKQRLFCARNIIKEEATKMKTNHILKPIDIAYIGTGKPVGNDPRTKAERLLSKNLVYLCRNTPQTAKELSEKLSIPMPFIEEEIEIQLKGENGTYGLLRRLDNGKYISNIIILDAEEFNEGSKVYLEVLDEFTNRVIAYLTKNKERILSFPFLNKQHDLPFITWSLISRMNWQLESAVNDNLKNHYFKDIEPPERDFSSVGIAYNPEEGLDIGFYGCDGITGENLCGYTKVNFVNIYGARIKKHIACGHNLSTDPQIMLTLKAIEGIDSAALSEEEKEVAAKAIENGYIQKSGTTLTPKILVIDKKNETDFYKLSTDIQDDIADLANQISKNLAAVIKKITPKHLLNEYPMLCLLISLPVLHRSIERCIEKGILNTPEKNPCAEGTWLIVQK